MTDAEVIDTLEEITDVLERVRTEIAKRIVGQRRVVDQLLTCLLADGNALLESNPGLGKTLLVRTIADISELEFSRIQNTPDLMPSDVIGTEILRDTADGQAFVFERGPVFANIVLADEINRATPKTQSALLEAMQERQVTAAGQTYALPDPFFLLATENPIDLEGSLHPDESVYLNGRIYRARDALEYAKSEGELVHESSGTRLYDIGASTATLSSDGTFEETGCMVYEADYEGSIYRIQTATGRQIRVSGNHPFLVGRDGRVEWIEAKDLGTDDYLVTPKRLKLSEEPFPDHDRVLDRLEACTDCKVVRMHRIQQILERDLRPLDSGKLDDLRIAAGLSERDLARRAGVGYERVVEFLSGTANGLGERLRESFREVTIRPGDYVDSINPHRIDPGISDEEAGFFIGFLLAEGNYSDTRVEVSEGNRTNQFERWIGIADGMGLPVEVRERPSGRQALVVSRPFVTYLRERYHLDEPARYLSGPRAFKRAFIEAFMPEVQTDTNRRGITIPIRNRTIANVLSYLLLAFDIVPRISERERIYTIRIRGEDVDAYLRRPARRGDQHHLAERVSDEVSSSPVESPRTDDGLLTAVPQWTDSHPTREPKWDQLPTSVLDGVGSPAVGTGSHRASVRDPEAALRRRVRPTQGAHGRSLVDVAGGRQSPRSGYGPSGDHVMETVASDHPASGRPRQLIEGDVFYDRVTAIKSEPYAGPVIGLSVPEHHNYLAGLGACGINHNTYPLPEAQADRFMMKILVDYPSFDEEREIVDRYTTTLEDAPPVDRVIDETRLREIQELVRQVPIADDIKDEAVSIVQRTRDHADIDFGASPRASMGLVLTAKARALLSGRTHVSQDDLSAMAPPVLRHRLILNFQAEREGKTPDDVIDDLV